MKRPLRSRRQAASIRTVWRAHYWVVDLYAENVRVYTLDAGGYGPPAILEGERPLGFFRASQSRSRGSLRHEEGGAHAPPAHDGYCRVWNAQAPMTTRTAATTTTTVRSRPMLYCTSRRAPWPPA